ncbi:hypothetical protein B7P43_G15678 [Cryptotermes secundus]|uniref:Neuropeptide-like 1 n=1 Tax=Cryptotermes secundus TaxID=105785 RepID=A0A2J7RQT5_9NEOP|nr:uncharacterized protein LOC111863884 isoform X2 [Cryptotermes secundus]PNF43195.1 hypothetical protein B7P43_G15678 [Cryptotermes secundus]
MWLCKSSPALLLLAGLLVVIPPQVVSEEIQGTEHKVEKRHVGALARTGQLPFQGKRSYASLAKNGDLPLYVREVLNKKMHPMMAGGRNLGDVFLPAGKRYLGSVARSGALPFSRAEGKRSESDEDATQADNILQSILETEDLWRLQLRTLKQELLREKEEELDNQLQEEETEEEKRNFASLAKSGNLPFKEGKRSVEALARAGYLPVPRTLHESEEYPHDSNESSEELVGKRNIAAMAKNGLLGAHGLNEREDALDVNGHLHQKRLGDDVDELIQELYEEGQEISKRNIGSLARGFNFPYYGGKRNLGSIARAGGFRFGGAAKKNDDDESLDGDKRSVTSLIRNRISPLREGKRYIGSIVRNQGSRFGASKKDYFESDGEAKRNIGAMARNWHFPEHLKYGKRLDDEEGDAEDMAKQYVANLLRQDGLPVGVSASNDDPEEDKRHIGSLAAKGSFQIHKKSSRSSGSDGVAYNSTQQVETSSRAKRSLHEENHIQGEWGKRTKRQAFLLPAPSSDEFPMPVMQNSDLFDYEDFAELLSGASAPEKRFLGRIPQMGSKGPRTTPSPGRKRPHARNI